MREFIDDEGTTWKAYAVGSSVHGIEVSRLHLPDEYSRGWLAIECGDRRYRIAPVPAGWADMSNAELCAILARALAADAARPMGHRTSGPAKPDDRLRH